MASIPTHLASLGPKQLCYLHTQSSLGQSGQRLENNPSNTISTHGHHQMVNNEIRISFLQPKIEKLYTVSKNEWELTVVQIMNFLLPNSD